VKLKDFIKKNDFLIIIITIVSVLSLINFYKSLNFLYPDWDGFWYLSYSKNILLGKGDFLYEIRSPLTAIILPDLLLARIEMIFFHVGITILIYLIILKLTENKLAAAFSSLVYGINWWILPFLITTLTDLPAMFFFLLAFYLWLNGNKRDLILSGFLLGIAFLIRYDTILLILPVILLSVYQKRKIKYLILPFLIVSIFLELLLSSIIYGKIYHTAYATLQFYQYGLKSGLSEAFVIARESNITVKFLEVFYLPFLLSLSVLFYWKEKRNVFLLSIFIPFAALMNFLLVPDNRIFFVKALPFLALLSHNLIYFIKEKINKQILLIIIFFVVILSNFIILFQITYPEWHLERTPCLEGSICANIPGAINYFCEKNAIDINSYSKGYVGLIPGANSFESIKENAPKCDYLVYYKGGFGYDQTIKDYLSENYDVIIDNDLTVVYGTN